MTLLNAPEFDEKKETRKHNILVGSGILIAAHRGACGYRISDGAWMALS